MTSMGEKTDQKPHAVCIPYPAQGHINPMLQLAKLLHHSGFHITFVHTDFNYGRLLKSGGPASVAGLPDFQFETIPDGLLSTDEDATQDIPLLSYSISKTCLGPFRELLVKLQNKSTESHQDVPPLTCIVSDGAMSFTLDAAEEFEVPIALFWTPSACGVLAYSYYPDLVDKGLIPLKDESQLTNGYLRTPINNIPGMEGIQLKDLPSFIRTRNLEDLMFNFCLREIKRASKGSAIILNTFQSLEHDVLNSLSERYKQVLPIGPLHFLTKKIPEHSPLNSIGSSLWKENPESVTWLDTKSPNSVIYVNYGSITVMTRQQLIEFAWGLANSQHSFLWIIRPDLVAGNTAILPHEFLEETKGRGFLASWCHQEQVLSHPSVGGFLTHCGWNSTIESIGAGIPMLCWPFFSEQHTNCWFACGKWGTGMEVHNDVKRDDVEKLVRELMAGNKGKEMKRNALQWKRLAEEAVEPNGTSTSNFNKLVNEVLISKIANAT